MKLQLKVPLLVTLILTVFGLISGGAMLYFQRTASITQFQRMAISLTRAVQGSLEQGMLMGELGYTREAMVRITEEEMVNHVVLYSSDGKIAASSGESEFGITEDTDEIRRVMQSAEVSMQNERRNGHRELRVVTPVLNKPECQGCHDPGMKVLGAIKVGLNVTSIDNQARQQTMLLGVAGGLTLLIIGGGLAFALKRAVLNPLSRLAESAQTLSRGDYTVRARKDTDDEIGTLAQAFNELAGSVEQRTRELEVSRQELARWNMDLEDKVQQRTGELSALNAIVTTINQSLDLDRILNDALTKILTVLDIEAGAVHLLDEKSGLLVMMVHRRLSPDFAKKINKLKLGDGVVGRVAQSGEPIIVNDVTAGPRTTVIEGETGVFQAYISLPVQSRNRVLGTLSLASYTPNKFDAETLRLLSATGEAIGIAVDNARGAQSLEEANKIRENLLEKLISAQEEERRRIARELHDEACQSMAALAINLETIADSLPEKYHSARQKLRTLKERAIQTAEGIRNLALELRPSILDDLGLFNAIDWYAKGYLVKRGIDVKIDADHSKMKLPPYTETMLFRIIQEALTNVGKHAEATKVRVRMRGDTSRFIVEVEDNGKGFDVEAALKKEGVRQNLGLHGMSERATLLGGSFNISSEPGKGTTVHVEVPLPGGKNAN
ncbi:MAG: GAF domain-containing protein [Dehalococcoidia bacterium]|nr:GAF domain-containing protein [Dehalococcoidia bacterium]